MTHVALGDDTPIGIKYGHFVGAVPRAVLAADACIIIMIDDAVVKLDVRVGRATFKTLRVDAVVT